MSYDALTISAVMIIIFVIFVVVLVGKNRAATEFKLRSLSRNLSMLASHDEAREICKKIREKYPDLCAGLDYTMKLDGDKVKIDKWNAPGPRPDL
ncbi:MAG: hypothetical protein LJE83_06635 [Gammaproteobacteria bacterium]|nr:hypothetical protein [Gammaproteobacteria bacterium]